MIDQVLRGEQVDADLDRLIERRANDMSSANAEAAAERMASASRARRYREALLWQRLEFHEEQLVRLTRTFEELMRRHRVGIRLVEEALGITNEEERKTA